MNARSDSVAGSALVDVILPAYNGRQVIRKAIESALAQDVPLKLIVVDDGSSDDTGAIARSYGSNVTVITQSNRGVSGARNTGLAASRAPYIALLDQDDVWLDGKLSRQLELMQAQTQVGLVFTDMVLHRSDGTIVEDGFLLATPPYAKLRRTSLGDGAYLLPPELAQAVVRYNFISPSTVVLRRQAIQEVGAFDEAFRLCDDAECWMRLLHRWRGISIETPLVRSLLWEGNASLKADKLILERIRIGEKAQTQPGLFPPGTVDYFRRELPISCYRLGIIALDSGDVRTARQHLKTSLGHQWSLRTLLALAATYAPAPLRSGMRWLKRAAGIRWAVKVE